VAGDAEHKVAKHPEPGLQEVFRIENHSQTRACGFEQLADRTGEAGELQLPRCIERSPNRSREKQPGEQHQDDGAAEQRGGADKDISDFLVKVSPPVAVPDIAQPPFLQVGVKQPNLVDSMLEDPAGDRVAELVDGGSQPAGPEHGPPTELAGESPLNQMFQSVDCQRKQDCGQQQGAKQKEIVDQPIHPRTWVGAAESVARRPPQRSRFLIIYRIVWSAKTGSPVGRVCSPAKNDRPLFSCRSIAIGALPTGSVFLTWPKGPDSGA